LGLAAGVLLTVAPSASAVPARSEFPTTWTVAAQSQTATATTATGVTVTATLTPSAPGVELSFGSNQPGASIDPTGPAVIGGQPPAYLPSTTSGGLNLAISNCSAAPCGTLTYTFSRPVTSPILYLGNQGAAEISGTQFATFHDSPVTLLGGGTLSYDSTSSHTTNSEIVDGTTVEQIDPSAAVGQPTDTSACNDYFSCSATDVNLPAPVTTLAFSLGYEGTGTSVDAMVAILGVTPTPVVAPAAPSLSVVKTASTWPVVRAGDRVDYTFVVTNTGNVALTGVSVLDTFTAPAGPAIAVHCPTANLPAGAAETCIASYLASQADIDQGRITNSAIAQGRAPADSIVSSAPSTATVTVVRVPPSGSPSYTATKSSNPPAGTPVYPGQTVRYTITITSNGTTTQHPTLTDNLANVLDDATYNDDATANIGTPLLTGTTLTWTSTLAPGQTVSLTYSIHLLPWDQEGDHRILNLVVSEGLDGNCLVADPENRCLTSSPVYRSGATAGVSGGLDGDSTGSLANTGADIAPLSVVGGLLIVAGAALNNSIAKRKTN
jgi:uncharacterized repeat protein (TIGR01451 family)